MAEDETERDETERLLEKLDIGQKVRLLTGASNWRTYGEPAVGLRPLTMSDGPAGVRGEAWDERRTSLVLPSPTALAASWDGELVQELGGLLAAEARRKGVQVLLAPTLNLHRSPLGGRHFECFSEDPLLTARTGVAFVTGVQEGGSRPRPSTSWPTTRRPTGCAWMSLWTNGRCASCIWPRSRRRWTPACGR